MSAAGPRWDGTHSSTSDCSRLSLHTLYVFFRKHWAQSDNGDECEQTIPGTDRIRGTNYKPDRRVMMFAFISGSPALSTAKKKKSIVRSFFPHLSRFLFLDASFWQLISFEVFVCFDCNSAVPLPCSCKKLHLVVVHIRRGVLACIIIIYLVIYLFTLFLPSIHLVLPCH